MPHTCPVCGYPNLVDPPRRRSGGGSFEICPSCGFQFGVSDDDAGFTYESWRSYWQEGGRRWASKAVPAPPGWDPGRQLRNLRGQRDNWGQAPPRSAPRRRRRRT